MMRVLIIIAHTYDGRCDMTLSKMGVEAVALLLMAAATLPGGCSGPKEDSSSAETPLVSEKAKDSDPQVGEVAKVNGKDEAAATMCDLSALAELVRPDTAAAKSLYKQALTIREGLYGPSHPKVAYSLGNLATACKMRKEYDEAAEALGRAVGIYEATQPQDCLALVGVLADLGEVLHDHGKQEEANKALARAVACAEAMKSDVPQALTEIANSLNHQGRQEEAVQYLLRAMDRLAPGDSFERGDVRQALIEAYWSGKDFAKAQPLLEERVAEAEKGDADSLKYVVEDLARFHAEQGQYADAAALCKRYAGILRNLGRDQEAMSLEQRATRLSEKATK